MSDTLNIFRWAPKELSQDAFICWMLSWADPQAAAVDPGMHKGGVAFLTALLALHGETAVAGADVAVQRQIHHTDIVALIGDDLALLIEGKTNTKDGVEKLKRYVEAIQDEDPAGRVLPVYFKTGDQGDYSAPRHASYKPYLWIDLLRDLAAMAPACGHNAIFADFLTHMEGREEAARIYERSAVSEWEMFAWQGFFLALQDPIGNMDWDLFKPPGALYGGLLAFKGLGRVGHLPLDPAGPLSYEGELLGRDGWCVPQGPTGRVARHTDKGRRGLSGQDPEARQEKHRKDDDGRPHRRAGRVDLQRAGRISGSRRHGRIPEASDGRVG